jgi:hypothetical protein
LGQGRWAEGEGKKRWAWGGGLLRLEEMGFGLGEKRWARGRREPRVRRGFKGFAFSLFVLKTVFNLKTNQKQTRFYF